MNRVNFPVTALGLGIVALAPHAVRAQEEASDRLSLGVRVGAEHSDNVERLAADETSDTIGQLGLQAEITRTRGRMNLSLASDLRYEKYFDDTFGENLIGGLNGTLSYAFIPERLRWVVAENFGQTFIDPVVVETPQNRQHVNFFSTGPDLTLPIGDRTQVSVMGRWSKASYELSESDDERLLGNLGLIRQLGDRSRVSLNGQTERVEFEVSGPGDGYDRHSAYLGFEATGARTKLNMRAGVITLDAFGDTSSAPLFDVTLSRETSARSELTLNAGTTFTDSAEMFRRGQNLGGIEVGNDDIVASNDPFQSDYARLAWTLNGTRTTLGLTFDYSDEDHETADILNRSSVSGGLILSRRLSSTLTGSFGGEWRSEDFDEVDVSFDEWSAGLGLDWVLSSRMNVMLRGDHFEGTGDTFGAPDARDYEENRVSVALTFTPHW
jgi:hypothetical protein